FCCDISAARQASGADLPCAIDTSIWRSNVTICSALNLFFGMTSSFPSYSLTTLGLKKPGQVSDDRRVLSATPGMRSRDRIAVRDQRHPWQERPGFAASLPCLEIRFRLASAWCHSDMFRGNARSALHCHFRFWVTFLVDLGDFGHRGLAICIRSWTTHA